MKYNLKSYKINKLKKILKKQKLILIFHNLNLKSQNWLNIEQALAGYNLKFYKLKNGLTKHIFKSSIFSYYHSLFNGSTCIIYNNKLNKNIENNVQKLIDFNSTTPFLTLKLNKKIYSKTNLNNISTLNYKKNITILNKTLKTIVKSPYQKFY